MKLKELQTHLDRLITAPEGVATALAGGDPLAGRLEKVICSVGRLSPVERLDIYANAYFYRLLDALKEDFPAVLAVVGDDNFHNLITHYLLEHPSTNPSVAYLGQSLADFLGGHEFATRWNFIAELARLERALIDVFHGRDSIALNATAVAQLTPEQWPSLRLKAIDACELIETRWAVDEIVDAVTNEREWSVPPSRAAVILVWRKEMRVYYRPLEPGEAKALAMLRQGVDFEILCEAMAKEFAEGEAATGILRMLQRWLADALLAKV